MTQARLPETETLYEAFLAKDSSYDGLFVTAVRTTGIFCRPSCRAKKPKRENVEFFAGAKEAIDNGYRPCKLCRPMEPAGATPDWMAPLVQRLEEEPRIRDGELREMGLDPGRVRRWFQRHHGMTFQAYARQLRINNAYGTLKQKAAVTSVAFDQGYESLSGFGEAFKRATGFAPSASPDKAVVTLARIPTPLGPMVAGVIDGSLCLLEFADRPMLETQLTRIRKAFRARLVAGTDPLLPRIEAQLTEYFAGRRKSFSLPLASPGSEFQVAVWRVLRDIPYGETRSYAEQAAALGRPEAVRAVARANGDNRIAIVIPCHRVVGKDGSLTGYGGGLHRKRFLLDLEAPAVQGEAHGTGPHSPA